MAGEWAVYRTKPFGKTYGFCLPMFFHNSTFLFEPLGVFSDHVISCFGGIDRADFDYYVETGRAAVFPPAGAAFGFWLLGYGTITEAEWESSAPDIIKWVEEKLHVLNPSGKNVITLCPDGLYRRNATPIPFFWRLFRQIKHKKQNETPTPAATASNPLAYYLTTKGQEIPGTTLLIFALQNGDYHLTQWFVFANGMSRIGGEGKLLTEAEVDEQWATGMLSTTAPQGEWIHLDGLGRFRSDDAKWYVKAKERQKEAHDEVAMLNGAPGTQSMCMAALANYEAAPSDANKESLPLAYDVVPEHRQIFCGDMDGKDSPIRNILGLGRRYP